MDKILQNGLIIMTLHSDKTITKTRILQKSIMITFLKRKGKQEIPIPIIVVDENLNGVDVS